MNLTIHDVNVNKNLSCDVYGRFALPPRVVEKIKVPCLEFDNNDDDDDRKI